VWGGFTNNAIPLSRFKERERVLITLFKTVLLKRAIVNDNSLLLLRKCKGNRPVRLFAQNCESLCEYKFLVELNQFGPSLCVAYRSEWLFPGVYYHLLLPNTNGHVHELRM
jgi:hypothetical protein